ncbi:xylanase [Kribbella antibiotica]|uniref:Xylanase n=1 Tax=Kribbella antibiotica TaxID=190195 RepID=A0A4R4ZI36_9ACTN|nr:RICIN domain-containing protein [Kribbella antibiotica]TDD57760.1 xylanase [Kribbella antibiotica]
MPFARALLGVLTAGLALTVAPTAANASVQFDYSFPNIQTGRCLDNNGTSLYTLPCNHGANQTWYPTSDSRGLRSNGTNQCLDSNSAGRAYVLGCNGGAYQQWVLERSGLIRNVATGLCLDSNHNGAAYTLPCNSGNRYQLWGRA